MKKAGILVIALCMVMIAKAQNGNDEARNILEEVSAKVNEYDNIVIDFKYSLENTQENVKHETRGDVSLEGEKYVLNIMGTTRMFDGKKIYTIIPEDEEINISDNNEEEEQNITPSKMLTFYNDGYNYEMDITQNVKGRKIQYIKLTPIDSNAEIKNILLGIDRYSKHIYNLIQTQDNGTKITITVNSFKTNQPLPESLFKFKEDKYKNYYINRLN